MSILLSLSDDSLQKASNSSKSLPIRRPYFLTKEIVICYQYADKLNQNIQASFLFHWKQPSLFSVIDAHWRPYEAASFAKGGATLDSDINSPTHNEQKSTITKKVPSNHGNSKGYITVSPKESPALSIN